MAQYDGSIKVDTTIKTKQAQINLDALKNRIVKTSGKIASLRSKMDSLKNAKIPTQEYEKLQSQLDSTIKKYEELDDQVKTFQNIGMDPKSEPFRKAQDEAQELYMKIEDIRGAMFDLEETGKAFTLGSDTEKFAKLGQELQYAENDLEVLSQKHEILEYKQEKAIEGYKDLGNVAKKSFDSIGKILTKANSHVNSFGKSLKNIAQKILPTFHKETKKTSSVLGQFSTRLKSLLSGIFIFNLISSNIRKMFSGINDGFENFYNQNTAFKSSVDNMKTSLLQLKNSLAAAFAPIVSVAIPYLEKLISYITKAVNSIGQLVAALLGKKTYTKAVRTSVDGLEDTSDAFEEVEESAKDAEKAIEGYLSPLDEINKYNEDKEVKIDIGTGKKPDTSDIGDTIEDMFEEVPIDSYFLDLANKVKDIFSQLFAPLKEAWNREGKFVMDSWKYALGEVWDLIKSIGSDFLEVWQQEKTIKIFEDLLHIIGDIGLVVGNLAHNFRLAWEENETGKRILEGIRDIIGVIVANIRHAADATVEWSKNLNFSPLLTAIKGWIESLVPVFDNLSGIITDFYEKVLLPLGKWTIEKGLPELLQVFIDFNNKVDWEALRSRLAQFWEHLEPFAETVGEGLIIFIERCANALADFINSPAFDNFLTMIENWMDSVKPEDVADALETIAKSIIALKVAVVGFSAISKGLTALSSLANILKLFGAGGGISSALGVLKSIGTTIAGWAPHIAVGTAIVGVIGKIKDAVSERIDTSGFGLADWISESLKLSLEGWKSEFDNFKISLELWWQDTWMADTIWKFGQWWNEKVKPWFTQEKWAELWEGIKTAFFTKWGELVEWWNNSTLVTWWNESVAPWFTIEKWLELYENIKQALVEKWNEIVEWWSATAIVGWWEEHVTPWFTTEKWMELFENIKTSLKEVWDNTVGQWATDISAWWEEHVAPWFTQEKWEEILNSVPEAFSNAFTKVIDTVKEKIQSIVDWVVEKIDWLKEKVSSIEDTFSGITSKFGGFFSGGFSRSTFSTTSYNLVSPAIASLSSAEIPKLATGAVIPANREFLAVLGDQKHGTNVEAPLDTIKQATEEAVLNVLSKFGMSGGNTNGTPVNVILQVLLDGAVIGQKMVDWGKLQQMATGSNPYELGTT